MYPYVTCLAVNGQIYRINQNARLLFDERGLPYVWKINPLPDVRLIELVPENNAEIIEQHPLRKALFKYLAAKEHRIFEKQRPQDVTIDEAITMVREALRPYYASEDEIEKVLQKHFPS